MTMTKQVRISAKWHRILKIKAAQEGTTVTYLLGRVCQYFFEDGAKPKTINDYVKT